MIFSSFTSNEPPRQENILDGDGTNTIYGQQQASSAVVPSGPNSADYAIYLRNWTLMKEQRKRDLAEKHREVLEALENHNAKALVSAIEKEALPSQAAKQYFQKTPFTSSLSEEVVPPVESPFAHGFMRDVAFPKVVTKASLSAPYIQDIELKAQDLWDNRGLGVIVQKAHCQWRHSYVECLCKIIDNMLPEDPTKRLQVACEIFSSTELGSPSRNPFYKSFLPVLMELFLSPERGSMIEEEVGRRDTLEKDMILYKHLHGRQVRHIFSVDEEAMVLMVTRKHLLNKFGYRVSVVLPTSDREHGGTVPALPEILGEDEEVVADTTISEQDVRYFQKVRDMLSMHDTLSEASSMLGGKYDVFSCSHPEWPSPEDVTLSDEFGM